MSFVDQERSVRPTSIAAVVLVHVAIGAVVVSGLAVRVIHFGPPVTVVQNYKDDMLPPPPVIKESPPPPAGNHATALPLPPLRSDPPIETVEVKAVDVGGLPPVANEDTNPPPQHTQSPATPDLGRGAGVAGDRASWVTTADYPASAARVGAEGTTAIRVTVGADGRAGDCRVTLSSGNQALDEAACRTYLRRARFRPAPDHDGHPIASDHADRIKWVLPVE